MGLKKRSLDSRGRFFDWEVILGAYGAKALTGGRWVSQTRTFFIEEDSNRIDLRLCTASEFCL